MKIIITGGAGFIGSNLVELLLLEDHQVIVIDDLSTGNMKNIAKVLSSIQFIKNKVEDVDLESFENIDAVVHLAAQPSVPLSISDFKNSSSSNIISTINVVDYCKNNNIPLVYASSSAVYGNLIVGDDKRSDIDLLSPYATDKFAMELYASTAYKLYGLSSIGLRFFNVYGPRQDPGSPYSGVISIFADRLLDNKNIIINGGHQTRDFIYVQDVTETIYRAVNISSESQVCEISNVLTGDIVTIDDLADQMIDIIGAKVEKSYNPLPAGDPEQSDGTIEKMVELFKIKLTNFTKLNEGLIDTIQYIRDED